MQAFKNQIKNLLNNTFSRKDAQDFLDRDQQELEHYFLQKEWEEFIPETLPTNISRAWFKKIQKSILPIVRTTFWKRWVTIAAMLIVVSGSIIYFVHDKNIHPIVLINDVANRIPKPQQYIITNLEKISKKYMIPDSSIIELSPLSSVKYTDPMEANKRSVYLDGEAIFYVKKDALKPFTVYSLGIATTALGTVFKISSFKKKALVNVYLMRGKILVQNINDTSTKLYLVSGEQCSFDQLSAKLSMGQTQKNMPALQLGKRSNLNRESINEINFNNLPLPLVLEQLARIFKSNIIFSTATLNKIKFTGTCNRKGTLQQALLPIMQLNALQYTMGTDTVFITKK